MTEKKHHGRQLTVQIRTKASPEQVWQAWTDPEKLAQWFVDKARGKPEVGTTFTWIFEKFNYEIPYEVVVAEPGKRFALGGEVPERRPFLLEVTIAKDGGESVVKLVNSGFLDGKEWDEEYEGIVSGWWNALGVLKHYLENYFGQPKSTLLVLQPAVYEYDLLLPYYATGEGLRSWLASSASIGAPGEPCALVLEGGGSVTGRVLSRTAWEVALSWKELDAVLELKGFRMSPAGRVVGIRVTAWGPGRGELPPMEARMQAALSRLAAILEKGGGR